MKALHIFLAAASFLPLFAASARGEGGEVQTIEKAEKLGALRADADVKVTIERNAPGEARAAFEFKTVPSPSKSDAAAKATFTVIEGRRDSNGGDTRKLHDGFLPPGEDEPAQSFFFAAGTEGGRLLVELPEATTVQEVNTYSWHPGTRGPQVYKLYAAGAEAEGLDLQPARGVDPATCGWRLVASVDTREKGSSAGGQHAVSITGPEGNLGEIRHLLFDISRTEDDDPFGNTFFSEIDVVAPDAPRVAATPYASEGATIVETEGSKHRIVIDTSDAPDLAEWATSELAPVVKEWYPKIIELLPSEGYTPAAKVTITFSSSMRGVAATGGTRITCAASWYRQNLKGEAKGSVVHELVHVVQAYGLARRRGRGATRTPGWLVEGIADYIRWFLYEPQSRGAEISRRALPRARYDASYRVSANFLSWVVEQHGAKVVRELNAAAREGRYTDALWKDLTGVALEDLGAAWKEALEKKLDAEEAAAGEKAAAQ